MALVLADRVLETSTSEGLGTFALAGAQTGYQTFSSGIGDGNTCYYTINGQTTEQWEVGIGTVGAGTLARTTLISSNTGSFINFVAGVKNVFVTQPASKSIYKDENGNAIPLGSASATQLDITAQGDLRLQDTTGGQYVALQAPSTIATSYTLTMPADDGTAGQALVTDGSGVLSWSSAASGDVYGPASATDNAVARYDGTTGKIIQNSAVTIGDDGATVIAANSSSGGLRITQLGAGNALVVEDSANPDASPFVVDPNGNVGIGESSPSTYVTSGLVVKSTSSFNPAVMVWNKTNDASSPIFTGRKDRNGAIVQSGDELCRIFAAGYDGASYISAASIIAHVDGTPGTNDMPGRLVFSTTADGASSSTERMRIDSTGGVGIGTTSVTDRNLGIGKNITGATSAYGVVNNGQIQSGVTTLSQYYRTTASTAAAAFTLTTLDHFSANQGTIGATSAVTTQVGFNASSSLTGATNNYGFYGAIASGTGRWNFYAAGTAANVFSGTTSIGGAVGSESLRVTPVASAVNYLEINGAIAASRPFLFANGSDTNVSMNLVTKGTGSFVFLTGTGSNTQLQITHTASAVNYLQVTGDSSVYPKLSAQGSGTNVGVVIASKGIESIFLQTAGSTTQLVVANAVSAVNYAQVTGSATGNGIVFSAQGSDTNIDLTLTPKGTGVLRFGTYTAGIIAQAGSITIKDAAGNTRRLLVG